MSARALALALLCAGCSCGGAAGDAAVQDALRRSDGARLTAESLLLGERDPGLALALAREGHARAPDARSRGALRAALDSLHEARCHQHAAEVVSAAWTAQGVLAGDGDGNLRLWQDGAHGEVLTGLGDRPTLAITVGGEGQRAVLANGDPWTGTRLYDVPSRRVVATLAGATAVAFADDGRSLATIGLGGAVTLHAATDGSVLGEFALGGTARAVAFRSRGNEVLAAGEDRRVVRWDVAQRRVVQVVDLPVRPECLACPQGGASFFVGGAGCGLLYRLGAATPERTIPVGAPRVLAAAFGADGDVVVVHVADGSAPAARHLAAFDCDDGTKRWELDAPAHAVAASADRERIAVSTGSEVLLLRLRDGRVQGVLRGHRDEVVQLAFAPDGQSVVTAGRDRTVRVWHVRSGLDRRSLHGHEGELTAVAAQPHGNLLATASRDGTVRLWGRDRAEWLATLRGHRTEVVALQFAPDGRTLASGDRDGALRVWDAALGIELLATEAHDEAILDLAYAPDGSRILTTSWTWMPRIWRAADLGLEQELTGHAGAVHAGAFDPSGRFVATAGGDATARVFDVRTGRQLALLGGHRQAVTHVAWRPDGREVLTASADRRVRVCDPATGATRSVLDAGGTPVRLLLARDGARAWCATQEGTVTVLSLADGTARPLVAISTRVTAFAVSADERLLATAGPDGAALWTAAGEPWLAIAERRAASALAFAGGGASVLVGFADGSAALWPVDPVPLAAREAPRALDQSERERFLLPPSQSATR